MLFIAFTMLGYISYKQLSVELLPNAELPELYVNVSSQSDVNPSYMEQQAIIPIEGAISGIDGVENIESTASNQDGSVRVDFKKNVNFKYTTLKLQEKINEVAKTLPDGFSVSVQKVSVNQNNNNFMSLQVTGSGGVDRIRNIVDEEITPELENIDGVATVSVYGGREKAIEIQLDPDACKALNITPSRISSLLSQNAQDRTFVGYVTEPNGQYFVHVNSTYSKVSDIENIVVSDGPVLLKDIATIFFDLKDETSYSRIDGKEVISVTLVNDAQSNLIELSHRTLAKIDELNNSLAPFDVQIVVQNNNAQTIEDNVHQITDLALSGGLLAIIILWFFLRNLRLVFFIALSIPISIYTAFNFFYAFDISINSLTLVGMALAVGMLLDNSVVVLENIYRLSGQGLSPEKSVTQGTKEVWRSILAATLTTITVFLPFAFSDDMYIKLMGSHIGVSIISTLGVSLIVALLFIPMTTYIMLKKNQGKSVFYEKLSITQRAVQIYLVLLKFSMRYPAAVIGTAVVVLFVTLVMSLSMNVQQMKTVEADQINISITMPTNNTLESSDQIMRTLEDKLSDIPERESLSIRVTEESGSMTLTLKEDFSKIANRKITDIISDVYRRLQSDARLNITVSSGVSSNGQSGSSMSGLNNFMRLLGVGENNEEIIIKGTDFETMQLIAQDLRYYISELDFISSTRVSFQQRRPELHLSFDPILLNSYDISRSNIESGLSSLNSQLSSGTMLKIGNDEYDIVIREKMTEEEEERAEREKTVDDLRAVQIESASGGLHDLQALAGIKYTRGLSQITRVNRDKEITITYQISQSEDLPKAVLESYRSEIDELLAQYNLPSGIAIEMVRDEDSFADFKFLLLAAFILIFMILASVFESVVTPFVLLFSIPLAAIGSLVALLLSNNSLLNANTLTGFLILLGVVVNNGIILIDYANILRKRGYRRNRALIMAGLSRTRPILITSITTIVAMLPLALGDDEYAGAIGAPFAITVIGGLSFSALLTLIFIPTVCMALENILAWYRTLGKKMYILHAILFVIGIWIIDYYASSLLWQIIYLVALIALIPGGTYFAQTSLRRANSSIISPDEPIVISIQNLVKIYDWPNWFVRQWQSGINIRRRLGLDSDFHRLSDFKHMTWQVAIVGFLVYLAYFYMENTFWIFVLSIAIYASVMGFWSNIKKYFAYNFPQEATTLRYVDRTIFWGLPIFFLFVFFDKMGNVGLVIVLGVLWILGLIISQTSDYLYDNNINIERVTGRFAAFKKTFFRITKSIPLIGKKRRPFKALRGVSFDIHTGMFGLLGPNGAGKSTLMRIVCGIFEQSYGTIWINGMDTRIYREELQSLIGFLPQEFGTYENMTAWEFLDYQAILKGIIDDNVREERLEYVLKAVHMYERKDAKIGSFSGGMKQRIGIALILLHLPRILVVDEPTAGLDPRERIRFRNLLVELSQERIVIFSTHIIEDISSSCNQVAVINKGELKYYGVPNDMINLALGKVWQFTISEEEFDKLDKKLVIIHMQDEDMIKVRYLSEEKPRENAVLVEANLEDAYLCLLKNM